MSLPDKNRGVVLIERGQIAIKDQEFPKYNDDQVLIRVKAVAINPADWKGIDYFLKIGEKIGHDFAGDIVAIGNQVQSKAEWKVGDAVAGCIISGVTTPNDSAFQEYIVTPAEVIWRKPANFPYEDAAAMGVALSTAVQAIHIRLGIPYEPITTREPFLVWGGSSGVGMYAIRLASLAGYDVVTVASKHNWDLVKLLGAYEVFDYKDPEVVTYIKEWAERQGLGPLTKAVDTISENGSIQKVIEILDKGGELVTIDWGKDKSHSKYSPEVFKIFRWPLIMFVKERTAAIKS
ncbi:GroES-like protein [Serendipita vermifera]|nr:GroES-like protein [Serendipita vermifera]